MMEDGEACSVSLKSEDAPQPVAPARIGSTEQHAIRGTQDAPGSHKGAVEFFENLKCALRGQAFRRQKARN
jgi:hypothetical protein